MESLRPIDFSLGKIHSLHWPVVPHEWRISGSLFILQSDLVAEFGEATETIESLCREWLAGLPESPRLTRETARTTFMVQHGHITVRAFKRAWQNSAPVSWHSAGAPKTG